MNSERAFKKLKLCREVADRMTRVGDRPIRLTLSIYNTDGTGKILHDKSTFTETIELDANEPLKWLASRSTIENVSAGHPTHNPVDVVLDEGEPPRDWKTCKLEFDVANHPPTTFYSVSSTYPRQPELVFTIVDTMPYIACPPKPWTVKVAMSDGGVLTSVQLSAPLKDHDQLQHRLRAQLMSHYMPLAIKIVGDEQPDPLVGLTRK